MANLNFGAVTTATATATANRKQKKLAWQPLTREELPPHLQAKWDATEEAYQAAQPALQHLQETEAEFQDALNASLKKGKVLPNGKVLILAFKKRFGKVAVALADIEEAAKKTSGFTFK